MFCVYLATLYVKMYWLLSYDSFVIHLSCTPTQSKICTSLFMQTCRNCIKHWRLCGSLANTAICSLNVGALNRMALCNPSVPNLWLICWPCCSTRCMQQNLCVSMFSRPWPNSIPECRTRNSKNESDRFLLNMWKALTSRRKSARWNTPCS